VDDFIFGTLATGDLRLKHVRSLKGGVTHNYNRIPRDPLPGQDVHLELTVGPASPEGLLALDRAWVYWSQDGSDPEGRSGRAKSGMAVPMEPAGVEWDTLLWGYIQRFQAVLPGAPTGAVVRYRLAVGNLRGDEIPADGGKVYGYYVDHDPLPEWSRNAVVYQVFVDRFFPGAGKRWRNPDQLSGLFGGTLAGITDKLDYISNLGANVLWLSPIFPSPSHHGYDATDFFTIEPRLGSVQDLRILLDEAHARDLRILLDFAPNHWSYLHPTFQDAIRSADSPYQDWYTFTKWPEEYESFFGVRELPQINLRSPAARQHVLDAAAYWLNFGVDGYRLDYAIGPTAADFWADFRRTTRQHKPDCWTFGEVVDPPDSQLAFEGLLDGCLDFLLLEALRQTFAFGRWSPACFAGFLDRHEAYFPADFSRPSFLDNHDMNRFLWAAGGDKRRLKLAALCQFTLSGPPVIYQGTEVGLSQVRDVRQGQLGIPEESRLPMLWGDEQDTSLLRFYKSLIALRRENLVFISGSRQLLAASDQILAYSRSHAAEPGGLPKVIILNLADQAASCQIPVSFNQVLLQTDPGIILSQAGDVLTATLPPLSGVVLQ
jgi:cyclomaltodextrinase / maltogenic alpha-amylase / neopullulanase